MVLWLVGLEIAPSSKSVPVSSVGGGGVAVANIAPSLPGGHVVAAPAIVTEKTKTTSFKAKSKSKGKKGKGSVEDDEVDDSTPTVTKPGECFSYRNFL
jgi:hypothetical protein